ncbi:ephrin type-A receptor 2-like, partial [Mustelus asterias]
MDCGWASFTLILFLLLDRHSSEEVTILDTSKVDGNLGWLTQPENGWELGQEMFNGTPSHMFRDCMLNPFIGEEHWLRSSWIHRGEARRVSVELDFTVRDCGSLGRHGRAPCRETFNLFYLETPRDRGLHFVPAEFTKIGTLAADQSFTEGDVEAGRARLNRELRSFAPGQRAASAGFYLALQNAGACVALVRLRLSYRRCPPARRGLATFPGTVSPAGTLPLEVTGSCPAASRPLGRPPRLHCGRRGDWLLGLGGCACLGGHQEEAGVCRACPVGFYKNSIGQSRCIECPQHSNTQAEGAGSCPCDQNFYRGSGELLGQPCTSPPTAPQNVSALLLGSKVTLSWRTPLDSGGRADLSYTVSCERCSWDSASCDPCVDDLSAQPAWWGLLDPWLDVEGLQPSSNYTFTVTALNGVSAQAGKAGRERGRSLPVRVTTSEGAGAPPPVTGVTVVHREESSLSVAWQPTEPHGRGIMGYEVMYQQQ